MAFNLKFSPVLAAVATGAALSSAAQTAPPDLQPITVTGKAAPLLDVDRADVGGFGAALARTPQNISVLSADLLAASAVQSLSQVLKLDASLADNYNTTGYLESLSIRGFVLDQGNNFRRNGLAVSNYLPLALENVERIEVLKGVAGLQTGVSAPGGLVNYVSKVPMQEAFHTATLSLDGFGGSKVHLDSNSQWAGVGLRVNLVDEQLRSHFERASGSRQLLSLAAAGALSGDTAVAANLEVQHKSQPSVPGLGLLDSNGDGVGERLPAVKARLNLNHQSWALPFQVSSATAQIAVTQRLAPDWQLRLAAQQQTSLIHDRIAFPDGCGSAASYVYPGLCANGDVDLYDYRSEGERRSLTSWEAQLAGRLDAFGVKHSLRLGASGYASHADLAGMQAYNYVGTTNIYAPVALPADPTPSVLNTNSRERSLSGYAALMSPWTASVQSFVGLRVTQLKRGSEQSDGGQAVSFEQRVSTPWAGLSWTPSEGTMLYASWGQGVELEAVPNRPALFANPGQSLPALKSEQTEIGLKWQAHARLLLSAAAFNIDKPFADDQSGTGADALPTRVVGAKSARHRGVELTAAGRLNEALSLQASWMTLDARYTQALTPALVGQRVTNVPRQKGSLFADYRVLGLPGLSLNALASYQGTKAVNADGSVELPSAWQLDAGLSYQSRLAGQAALWRLQMENLGNASYWREAPTTAWGGIYLFPSTPRTLRASLALSF